MAKGRVIYATKSLVDTLQEYTENCKVSSKHAQDVLIDDAYIGRSIRGFMKTVVGAPSFFEIKKRKGYYNGR